VGNALACAPGARERRWASQASRLRVIPSRGKT
jgi:hypothetical protein